MTHAPNALTTLGQMSPIVINLLVGVFLLVSIVMILIVLIQRPQGGGLGGAFGAGGSGGGGGAGQTAFGTKTGDVLTGATIGIFVLFVLFAIALNFITRPTQAGNEIPTASAPGTQQQEPATEPETQDELTPRDSAGDDAADAAGDAVDQAEEIAPDPAQGQDD